MNLVKEAIDLGFSNAAVIDTKKLVFVPEYRNLSLIHISEPTRP